MKNLNLIKRLWTDSHEKQKVRGMQKYCILLLLLFTCVTHAYAGDTPPTTKTASNLIIVKTTTETKSGWMWEGSSENNKARLFTKLGQHGSWYVSTFNNSTNKYTKMIAMNKDGFSDKSDWSGACYGDGNKITGDVTLNSYTSGENQYLEKSSSEITHQFVHLSVSTSLYPSSSVTTGTAVSVRYTSLSGDLSDNTNNKWNFFYSTDGGTTKTRFSEENKSYPTSGSSAPSFTPSVAGSYKVYAYLSDPWGIEVIVREINLTVSDPTYSITYHADGGSGTKPTDGSSPYTSGSTVTVLGKNTLYKTNYVFAGWNTENDGSGTQYLPGETFSISANTNLYAQWVPTSVLTGTNVMLYCGERTDWNQSTYKFTDRGGTQVASVSIDGSIEVVSSTTYKTGVATLAPNTTYYNQGHSGWSSGLECEVRAGYLYVVRKSTTSDYFTQKDNSGDNYLYEVSQLNSTTPATRSVTTTLGSSSFAEGTSTLSVTTTGSNVPGNSVLGRPNKLLYFLYDGSTWSPVTLSAGNLNVSSLTDGSYSLASVLTDGYIYVRADKDDFNVYAVYSIAYKDQGNETYSGSNEEDLPDSYTYGVGVALVDGEKSGFSFDGWFTDADCTEGPVTSIGTSATGDKTFYAKWTELSGGTVTLTAGTGGEVSLDNSSWGSSKAKSGITTNTSFNIYARGSTGYTFSAWAKSSGEGTITSTSSASTSFTPVANKDAELTASFTENMSTLSVNRTIDEGSPSIAAPTVTGSYTNVGYATTRTITAAAAATGYALTGWTITNGTRTDGGGATANPITVRSNGNASETVTVTANYSIQSYTISSTNTDVTYSPESGTSFKFGSTGDKMTITPKSGYKITDIDSDNDAITASADNNAAGSWTVTGTMPGTDVTLDITTAAIEEIKIVGRFKIYNSTRTAYTTVNGSNDTWEDNYNNSHISMTYNYITGYYDLATYRSAAELKGDGNLYFYLRNGSKKYGSTPNDAVPESSYPASANALDNNGGNFYMNSNDAYINVVLHFDVANLKLWYTGDVETLYSTTFYAGDHGSVNANGTSIDKNGNNNVNIGFCRTLTATPESGYAFDRWVTTGGVSVADAQSASTTVTATSAGGTVTAKWYESVNSGWYLQGNDVGGWGTGTDYPLDRVYPGSTNVYYRKVVWTSGDKYFRFHNNGTDNGADTNNQPITKGVENKYNVSTAGNGKAFKYNSNGTAVWVVLDVSSSPKQCWIQDPYYQVTFGDNASGSAVSAVDGSSASISSGSAYAPGTAITFSKSDPAGYDFVEWNAAADGSGTQLGTGSTYLVASLSADITVYAIYSPQTYSGVKLDRTTGSTDGAYSVTYMTNTLSVTTPPGKIGYDVEGYYKSYSDGVWSNKVATPTGALQPNISDITNGSSLWISASSPTLYTKWTAKTYTSENNLKKNGGDSDGKFTATYDATNIVINTAPEKTGYHVEGYYDTDDFDNLVATNLGALQANTDYTDASSHWNYDNTDAVLYAKWAPSTYTVTFNQHGTDETTIYGTSSVTATYDAEMPAITVPKKVGYTFGGYFTEEDGEGTQYYNAIGEAKTDAGVTTIWNIASNTELHAKWTGIGYQVEFDANGGAGSISPQSLVYGIPTTLTSNTTQITREGYYFLGWNTNADGSGTKFHNGKEVSDLASSQGATVTLYAQWAKTHTLYFLNIGTDGWDQGSGSAASATRYAYAFISYDGQVMYPLGTWETSPRSHGSQMTASSDVYLPNVKKQTTWSWSIAGVPEGATIIFSDNTGDTYKTGNLSGWTVEKPYYCHGNGTWYALDGTNEISKITTMSVYVNGSYHGIDKYGEGNEYAIVTLNGNTEYQFKYYNWNENKWSGCNSDKDKPYLINQYTDRGYSDTWGLDGADGGKDVFFYTTVTGEYKFKLTWASTTPQTTLYYPVGVALALDKTSAVVGESTTIRLTASPQADYLVTSPTYYYQISKDNTNWTTIATKSEATYDYTFAAQNCKFRVILQNDEGLKSTSTTQDFTSFSTRSFYVYNPYTESGWGTLYLYTWNGNTKYNGNSFPGYDAANCINGNKIESKGGNWFYITINESASCYILSGGDNSHQTVTCFTSNYKQDGKYMIFTENNANYIRDYKSKGAADFRLRYNYGDPSKARYSDIYNTYIDGTAIANGKAFMSSMWMNANDNTASITIEQGAGGGDDRWTDVKSYSNSSTNGFEGIVPSGKRDKGYVFQIKMNINTTTVASSTLEVEEYTGPFYVRTDGLNGGWNVYKKADHTMHYSEISLTQSTPAFDYSLCKWIGSGETNVKFTVGNEYNSELVASLEGDIASTEPLYNRQTIPTATNVRFSYNSHTNTLTRAYLSAASVSSSRFLVMVETTSPTLGKIYTASGQDIVEGKGKDPNLNEHELIFSDNGNWFYQLDMMANPGAYAKVTAKYNEKEPEFIASAELIGGTGETKEKYRVVYDFKTNILTSAWMPNGAISGDLSLNTNIMLIRKGQDAADQISCSTHKITNAKRLIGVMQFDYDDMVGKMSSWNTTAYQYCMYYISFPFDVKVNDIFGIGEMGTDWRLQKYNGEKRSQIGWFAETSTFWEDVKAGETLKAYEGYSLLLNRVNFNNGSSGVWTNISSTGSVYLYFPSEETSVGTIKVNDNQEVEVPSHVCNINRWFTQDLDGEGNPKDGARNHKITDSNWNMLGTALFENKTGSTVTSNTIHEGTSDQTTLNYIYEWRYATNTLAPRATLGTSFTFNAMHAYLVQFAGKVVFEGASISPKLSARRVVEEKNYMIEVELNKGETFAGRAYVELRENAVDSFLLNEDMYMLKNSRTADVYTYAGRYDVAANVLTVGNHVVPVGVNVKSAGEYTFSMPSNFSGEVTLIDTYTNTHTNLALEDYTVYLSKGEITDRFLLDININKMPTAIDGVDGGSLKDGKAHKFIENGQMYILQNGVIYDAQGRKIK